MWIPQGRSQAVLNLPLVQGAFAHEVTWAATDHKGAVGETSLGLGLFAGVLVLGCCWTCAWFVFINNGQTGIVPLCTRNSCRV